MAFPLPLPPTGYTRSHIVWEGGWLELDCCEREKISNPGEVTEHPVDKDADIADHFRLGSIPVVIDAFISHSPIELPLTHTGGAQEVPDITLIELSGPIFPGAPTNIAGFGDISVKRVVKLQTLGYTPALDRVTAVYEELEAMQAEPRLVSVALSRLRTFDNMLLENWSIDRDNITAGGMPLVLEFKRINLVAAQTTLIELPVKPKKVRSVPSKDGGSKQAKPTEKPSILKRIFG